MFDDWLYFDFWRYLNIDWIYKIGFLELGLIKLEDLKDIKKCIVGIVIFFGYLEENIRLVWVLYEYILIKMREIKKIILRKILLDCSD